MVEASIYSQFMAMGLAIEFTYFRRIRYLAIFALGLVLSFSGTGWLIMGAFVVGAVARQGGRGLKIGLGALSAAGVGLGVLAVASPELFEQYVGRVGEFTTPGSSGHLRFVTPWWAMSDFMGETPWALLVGGGAGVSERLHTQFTYFYGVNTPMKIALEYGLPGLVAYLALFLAADRTPRQSTLLAPALMFFLFTGTYAQFPPILFPVLLITSVARLRPTPAPPSNRVRPAAAGGTLGRPGPQSFKVNSRTVPTEPDSVQVARGTISFTRNISSGFQTRPGRGSGREWRVRQRLPFVRGSITEKG